MVGSIARYAVSVFLLQRLPSGFPWGTFVVNIIGCFLIGIVLGVVGRFGILTYELRLLLATGFCGGFTTLSSLAYEAIELARAQNPLVALAYVVVSVILGVLAAMTGMFLTR